MAAAAARGSQTAGNGASRVAARAAKRATCPFCALLCDDLVVAADGAIALPPGADCAKAVAGFTRAVSRTPADCVARIEGREASLPEALDAAAAILKAAKAPLYGGLATDVDGMRAVLELADRTGGVVDHAFSTAVFHNVSVMQSRGWVTTTLAEVRNRADVIVVLGDVGEAYPRFYERVVHPTEGLFGRIDRHVAIVGPGKDADIARAAQSFRCDASGYGAFLAALRAELQGRPYPNASGFDTAAIADLARRVLDASYPVFVWSPAKLDAADGDLVVLSLCDLVRGLNLTQRAAGLSLGGNEGGATAMAVTAWTTGYPMRVSFATGKPVYDRALHDIGRMIAAGEGDALVWTAAIGDTLHRPASTMPTILIRTPGAERAADLPHPDVLIPVGTVGVDHDGDLVRSDSVVSSRLRTRAATASGAGRRALPSVAEVAGAISRRLAT